MFEQLIALTATENDSRALVFQALRTPVAVCASGTHKRQLAFPESWGVTFASTLWATSSATSALGTGMLISAAAGWAGDTPLLLDSAVSRYEAVRLKLQYIAPTWEPRRKPLAS